MLSFGHQVQSYEVQAGFLLELTTSAWVVTSPAVTHRPESAVVKADHSPVDQRWLNQAMEHL